MSDPTPPPAPRASTGAQAPTGAVQTGIGPQSAAYNYKTVLQQMVQQSASDLHFKVGRPPTMRIDGSLKPLELAPLKPEDLRSVGDQILPPKQRREFETEKEADFAIGVPGIGRFRVNMYQQRGSIAYAFRAIAFQALTIKELNLPPVLEEIALKPRGLVLVTGITGSGKSTALASMVQFINETRRANIITIEDPIEFLHRDNQCNINQREVGTDTGSFAQALRRVLRQDPDIILIGENRDLDKSLNIPALIRDGTVQYGMQSFDQSLMNWYSKGVISYESALFYATSPSEFALKVQGVAGASDTSWDSFQQDVSK